MATHDIATFSSEGEKMTGVVIEHFANPLDDFYVVYANYALYRFHNASEDATVIIDNVIIPACDAALAEYRLKSQHLKDMSVLHKEMKCLIEAFRKSNDVESLFEEN